MFEFYASAIMPFVLLLVWSFIELLATVFPYTIQTKQLQFRRKLLIYLLYIGLALCAMWFLLLLEWGISKSWYFVEGALKAVAPMILLSHAAAARYTLSTLKRFKAYANDPIPSNFRADAAHPRFLLPIYAAALSSAICLMNAIFTQPILPSFFEAILRPIIVVYIMLIPGLFVMRRYRFLQRKPHDLPSLWKRRKTAGMGAILTSLAMMAVIVAYIQLGSAASRLPEASDMTNHHLMDEGSGSSTNLSGHHEHQAAGVQVADLTGEVTAPADIRFELIAEQKEVKLAGGTMVKAWTFNGEIAPELRVKQGDMVEVKLINKDIAQGVTVHWHGYNVPNAMDGVPGMTQDAVKPGEYFIYKFRANQAGTYWFHSHQLASEQVDKGLFGSFIVIPRDEKDSDDEEITFDPADYGKPIGNELTEAAKFDRQFTMVLGNELGFYKERFHVLWTINGKVYPHTPTLVVQEGELVKTTFINRSTTEHPMHLHGHHVTVLKKNGKHVKTPWLTDTLNVLPGETYEVAFVADNPGMWMDHCHILPHAATGMILHLMYDHVRPSYEVGTRSGNLPD
jgi:FtsP/CotA-like multicopper oxidase with cupredoxin domain